VAESTSLREDLEAATDVPEGEEVEVLEVVDDYVEEKEEEVVETKDEEEKPEVAQETKEEEVPATQEEKSKPPIDWSPTEREHWAKIPKEVQAAIQRREHDANMVMQQSSESRKVADHFVKTVEPYRAMMAAEGAADPFQAVTGLLNTAAQLHMGNPQQKAERIAGLINHYGIDIETLDGILSGQAPPPQQPQQQQPFRDPRVDDMLRQRDANTHYQAQQTIEQFRQDPANEFFDSVRLVMADFLDVAAHNGQQLSPQQAYDRACASNPEINSVLEQRKANDALLGKGGMMQRKRNAAGSIHGTQSGNSSGAEEGGSIRDILTGQFASNDRV
jgi:hypothetical protein